MRSQKIDAIRGAAIIGMMVYHAHYILLNIFGYEGIDFPDVFWHILGRAVAITFIVVAGISYRFSTVNKPTSAIIRSSMKRTFLLSSLALLISLVTFTWFSEQRIVFGIIHFFALAAFISPSFLSFGRWNMLIGIIILLLSIPLRDISIETDMLFPIGIISANFYSADYYPLIPWFGYFLIGYGAMYSFGNNPLLNRWLQVKHTRINPIALIGRHALLLYILHVPIIYLGFILVL